MQNKKYTPDQMFGLIEIWKQSGLSQTEFCNQKQLSRYRFSYWLKKYRKQKEKPDQPENNTAKRFFPVNITSKQEPAFCHTDYITITYPNGVKVCCPLLLQ